jgi:NTP pyrophosphatase (non-canonical NTP hydrolase)
LVLQLGRWLKKFVCHLYTNVCLLIRGQTVSRRRASWWRAAKEDFVELALAEEAGELAEGEERHQGTEDDDGARNELC